MDAWMLIAGSISNVKCKMDRKCRQGSLGLSMSWLQLHLDNPDMDIVAHNSQKETLSSGDCYDVRVAGRERLRQLAEANGPGSGHAEILRLESLEREGDTTEPAQLICRGLGASLVALARL